MQVDGEQITDEELETLTNEIRPFADAMKDSPTEFELITALAMKHFLKKGCDIVVLEVGLGGRLDSTNVIETPELAIITAIGFDHVKELGPTLCDIAREKAGIIKNSGDVLVYGGQQDVEDVFISISAERKSKLHKPDYSRISKQEFTLEEIRFEFSPYGTIILPLAGTYQPKNVAVAITAIEILREKGYTVKDPDIIDGLAAVKWPGRFEVLGRNPVFILDGSHNPQGMEATASSLRCHFGDKKIIFITGIMADKDADNMISHIAPLAKVFITVKPENPRAMSSEELAGKIEHFGIPIIDSNEVKTGVSEALSSSCADDVICALGSLYFSAEIRAAYNKSINF